MGIAGAAMLYGFISFFKLIGAFIKWRSWKSNGVLCPAVVVGVLEAQENYRKKKGVTHYKYNVAVDYQDKEPMTIYPMAVLEKTVYTNTNNEIAVGKETKLLYNPQNSTCVEPAELTGAIKSNLGALIASIVIFFLCMLIIGAIS